MKPLDLETIEKTECQNFIAELNQTDFFSRIVPILKKETKPLPGEKEDQVNQFFLSFLNK